MAPTKNLKNKAAKKSVSPRLAKKAVKVVKKASSKKKSSKSSKTSEVSKASRGAQPVKSSKTIQGKIKKALKIVANTAKKVVGNKAKVGAKVKVKAQKTKTVEKTGPKLILNSKKTMKIKKTKSAVSVSPLSAKKTKSVGPKGTAWVHPLDDRILVEVAPEEQTTPGGLILIDSAGKPENVEGFVIAVGRGHQNKKGRIRPVEVKAGDKIIFSKYAGDKISHDGVNFVLIRESEILGLAAH